MTTIPIDTETEWLETDGLGGFASGTTSGIRTRRYHAILLAAARPPAERWSLVAGLEAHVDTQGGPVAISSQRYGDVVHPDGTRRLVAFRTDPWPTFVYDLGGGVHVEQEIFAVHGLPVTVVRWRVASGAADGLVLHVRPLLSVRDPHHLARERGDVRFAPTFRGHTVRWALRDGAPAVACTTNGEVRHAPDWYRGFLYAEEQRRGLDCVEDLASPGEIVFDLGEGTAVAIFAMDGPDAREALGSGRAATLAADLADAERTRRAAFASRLHRAGDVYLVRRGEGRTIIAGYPWFGAWGRDTFIALRGLCLATGLDVEAREILVQWASAVSEGMLPNRFPDRGETPEYNSVDASLWFAVAVGEVLDRPTRVPAADATVLRDAVLAILDGHARGTRYGIRVDDDGLLAAGAPGVQLTWMDAKVGEWVVTPRIGKPVEVQALWANACDVGARFDDRWAVAAAVARASFADRFWNEHAGCLFDVIDVDHERGRTDGAVRPNQIFAIGGLPGPMLDPSSERARRVVDVVQAQLVTPLGLRSLAPGHPDYRGRYEGGVVERDGAYHEGTAWPWLAGPFVEAWLRVRGDTDDAREEAVRRFVAPLRAHLPVAGLGHVSEIADAEPPHAPRGCPFQAWSVAELLRLELTVTTPRPRPA